MPEIRNSLGLLSRIRRWRLLSERTPREGQPCWISNGRDVQLATFSRYATGGWSNEDTWHDFEREYYLWKPARLPKI